MENWKEKIMKAYNKGIIIKEVLVEYEEKLLSYHIAPYSELKLKINPKDNTITIKKVKDNWNREDVKGLLIRLHNEFPNKSELDNWINENL